jgi:flagellar hook-associated protein 1 FlgK
VVIDRADEFAARIRDTAARLGEIGESAKLQSAEVVKAINQMAAQFADLNKKVVSGVAAGQPPNDLLDQRDQLLAELNKKINVSICRCRRWKRDAVCSQQLSLGHRQQGWQFGGRG